MYSLQILAQVQFRSSEILADRVTQTLCDAIEETCIMDSSQPLKIHCSSWGEYRKLHILTPTTIEFQTSAFQCLLLCDLWGIGEAYSISPSGRQGVDFQDRVVRRHGFKCNIRMPAVASELAWFREWVDLGRNTVLLLHTADNADLITELTVSFGEGMDVKA